MTHPLITTSPYSTKIFMVKTFMNWPQTMKFVKVFTSKRFLLYGSRYFNQRDSNGKRGPNAVLSILPQVLLVNNSIHTGTLWQPEDAFSVSKLLDRFYLTIVRALSTLSTFRPFQSLLQDQCVIHSGSVWNTH